MYTRFQSSYYNRESQPFLTPNEFKLKSPIIVVDLSYQNESVKTGPIDVRISIELKTPSHENTQAYCLLIHDRLVEYNILIEPPYDFTLLNTKSRKTAIWLTNTHHKIFWNDGEKSFPQTRKYLSTITSGKQIICKGVEKKRFLQKFFGSRHLINIEETGCPSLNRFKVNRFSYCETHLSRSSSDGEALNSNCVATLKPVGE